MLLAMSETGKPTPQDRPKDPVIRTITRTDIVEAFAAGLRDFVAAPNTACCSALSMRSAALRSSVV